MKNYPPSRHQAAAATPFCWRLPTWEFCADYVLRKSLQTRGSIALNGALDWEYRLSKEAGGVRKLTNTKVKDHEPPPPISFLPETITLDGWVDPDDGTVMTSCVLHQVEGGAGDKGKPLTGAKKVAFDALINAIIGSGVPFIPGDKAREIVHIDHWREAAYALGISCSPEPEAKKKAFQRAVSGLRTDGLIGTWDDHWWPCRDTGQGRGVGRVGLKKRRQRPNLHRCIRLRC